MGGHHHHHHLHLPHSTASGLMRLATTCSLVVACVLILVKAVGWIWTDSVSLLSSLADSTLDVLTSGMNFLALRIALQPPDNEHRFGHGRVEDIAALGQAAFIGGSAVFIAAEALHRFVHPDPVQAAEIGIGVMTFSMVATMGLVLFQRYVIRKTGSRLVRADALHYLSDILSNLGVIAAFVLAQEFGLTYADAGIGMAIAIYLLWSAVDMGQAAFQHLMDRELDDDTRQRIEAAVLAEAGVLGMHDLKTRLSGTVPFVQFHLELDGHQSLNDAHLITQRVTAAIEHAVPHAEVIIHEDPIDSVDDEVRHRARARG